MSILLMLRKTTLQSKYSSINNTGRQLLKTLLDYSKEKGYAGVVLYTSEYAPASKFYENNGFKLSQGTICMYYA